MTNIYTTLLNEIKNADKLDAYINQITEIKTPSLWATIEMFDDSVTVYSSLGESVEISLSERYELIQAIINHPSYTHA